MPKPVKLVGGPKKKVVQRATDDVWDRIAPMHFEEDEGISVCVYGESGSGKTTFCSSFPGPILWIVCSGSTKPGELRSVNTPEMRKKIKTVRIENSREVIELAQKQAETEMFNTVVVDHGTGLQDWVMKELLNMDELPPQLSWGLASQQTWGQCALQMKELLRAVLSLSCNRIIVSQERTFKADEDNDLDIMPHVGPALTPSITGWLTPACDYVVQTYKQQKTSTKTVKIGQNTQSVTTKLKGVDYRLRTGPDATYMTKFRVPLGTVLPDSIVDPTYEKMMALVNGG